MIAILGIVIIVTAIVAILRGVDVRLSLLLAALILGALAGQPELIVRNFFAVLIKEQFVIPICCAMGFAHVLRLTGCDQHLVHLLVEPLQRVRSLLIPGAVLVGFLVNIPVVSQTSTAVAIGSVLIPLLLAAQISRGTAGAALLLGCSIGGELLNPAAPEFQTVSTAAGVDATQCVQRAWPWLIPQLVLATGVFWLLSARAEARHRRESHAEESAAPAGPPFHVNLIKAAVPLLPITLLFLTVRPLELIQVPKEWLTDVTNPADVSHFDSRLIGAAMLVGVVAAALTAGRVALGTARAFFEGAGYAFTHIISVIATADCFGKGVVAIGLAQYLGDLITAWPALLIPTAGSLPLAFAWVSGSGMASTQVLYKFFLAPARALGIDPIHVGAFVSIGAAAGRTMSPVAAVTLMCATLTETRPVDLIRRVAVPLLISSAVVIAGGALLALAR